MSRIVESGKRLARSKRLRIVIGLLFDLVSVVGWVLTAFGVSAPSLPWLSAFAVVIGTVLLGTVILSYHTELQARMAPSVLAGELNGLRGRLRDLMRDAYKPPSAIPHATWEGMCATLLDDSKTLIAEQRNKYAIPLRDAIEGRHVTPPKIMKNRQTMDMLNRVDRVLGQIVDEIDYR
jgi:hypothetical protein